MQRGRDMFNRFFTGNRTAPDASPTRRLPTEIETASLPDVAVGAASSDWICLEPHRFHGDNAPTSMADIEDESHGLHEDDAPARDSLPDDVEEGGDSSDWINLFRGEPIGACGSACGSATARRCGYKITPHQAGECRQ
jgi:hypothetical protein